MGLLALALAFVPGLGVDSPAEPAPTVEPRTAWQTGRQSLTVIVRGVGGEPIVGARIELRQSRGGPEQLSSEAGTATFQDLAAGTWDVQVEAEGHARYRETVEVESESPTLEITLAVGAVLEGRILDAAGDPVDGAVVSASPDGGGLAWQARTDDAGVFRVATLAPGLYEAEVSAAGFEVVARRIEARPEDPARLDVVLRRAGAIVGRVYGADGAPAGDALVSLAGSGVWPARSVRTEVSGRFRFGGVPAGVYEIRARRGTDVAPPRRGLHLDEGGTAVLALRLFAGRTLTGTVRDRDGAPIEAAQLVLTEEVLGVLPRAIVADTNGAFRFEGLLDQAHRLAVRAPGFVAQSGIAVTPGVPEDVVLLPGATLSGVVVDERDHPVANARVEVVRLDRGHTLALAGGPALGGALFEAQLAGPAVSESGELGVTLGAVPPIPLLAPTLGVAEDPAGPGPGVPAPTAPVVATTSAMGGSMTDSEGRFAIPQLPAGTFQLLVYSPSHAPGRSEPLRLAVGETRDDVRLVVPDGGRIDGRVVDGRGFPVSSVLVELRAEREPLPRTALTNDDGTFVFDGVLDVVMLTALPAGRPAARERLEVASGDRLEVELALEDSLTTLSGRAYDARRFPIEGVRVVVRSLRADRPARRVTTSADDGTFTFAALPPPPYEVEADHPEYATTRLERVVDASGELDVVLRRGGTIAGTVRSAWDDAPLADARVVVSEDGHELRNTATSIEGQFEIQLVAIGNYEVNITHAEHIAARLDVTLEANRHATAELRLDEIVLAPAGSIAGTVVDSLGAPVPGAQVSVGDEPDWDAAAQSDSSGSFVITGLAAGSHRVRVRHSQAGEATAAADCTVYERQQTEGIRVTLPERQGAGDSIATPAGELRIGVAISVDRRGSEVLISAVVRGSRAARAGLRVGDVIVTIDGEAMLAAGQARGSLRGAAGVEAVLEVRRRGRRRRIRVPREQYIEP